MSDIEINLTESGLQVLVDGYPSARFERYRRIARYLRMWGRALRKVFISGPFWALTFAIVLCVSSGSLQLSTGFSGNAYRLEVKFQEMPSNLSLDVKCAVGGGSRQVERCNPIANIPNNIPVVPPLFWIAYLSGMGLGLMGLPRNSLDKDLE